VSPLLGFPLGASKEKVAHLLQLLAGELTRFLPEWLDPARVYHLLPLSFASYWI
jgi:hypothetical protein